MAPSNLSAAPTANSHAASRMPAPTTTKTILVADDSRTVLRLTERTLVAAGYEVLLAEDGRQAVDTALANRPDLIVLDINMPELDGYGVCHELLANGSWNGSTPVIFLTSAAEPHLETLGNQLGAFLSKPTEPELLLDTVASLIQRKQPRN